MQTTLLSLGIAVIVALLAALLGPYFIDWSAHRATFEQQASQALGQPVRVTGPMDVRLLPSPRLVLSGLTIGKPDDPQAVQAKALAIEFALPPLFSGRLRATEMRLIGPEAKLTIGADGQALLPTPLTGVSTETFSIDKLTIEDARFELSDAASGTRAILSKLWFNGDVRALPGPIRGEGAFALDGGLYGYRLSTGRPEANGTRLRLSLDPSGRPVTADLDGLITVANGKPRFDGQAVLTRRIAYGKGDKGMPDPWRITARVKANAAEALFEDLEADYGPEERALKLTGTAQAKFGDTPRLEAVLSARQLNADKLLNANGEALPPRRALAHLLGTTADITTPLPVQIGFGVDVVTLGGTALQNVRGDLAFGDGAVTVSGFEARGPGFTQLRASGRLQSEGEDVSFSGPVDVASADPRAFGTWLEGKATDAKIVEALPARPLRLRGDVTLGGGTIAVQQMQAELDRKIYQGDFSYRRAQGDERSQLSLALRADEFDLDAALTQLTEPLNALLDDERPDDVSLSLALKRLRVGGVDAGKADVKLALNAAGLNIERLSIGEGGGFAIDGKGRIDLSAPAPRGGVSFNLAMSDPAAATAFAKQVWPDLAAPLQKALTASAPAKLTGTVAVEPSGNSGASEAKVALQGGLNGAQLNLSSVLSGQWKEPGNANVSIDASLDATDVNTLVKLLAAQDWVSVPAQPGRTTLSLRGKRDGDMQIDARIASANLEARAQGSIRPFADEGKKSAALDVSIGKADVILHRKAVPVVLRTDLKADGSRARLDNFNATIAGTVLRGQLGLAFGDVPVIDGDLRTGAIDVAALVGTITGPEPAKPTNERWSTAPFALPALPSVTGEVKVAAVRAALLPSFAASKLQAVLRFSPTQIRIDSIDADILGGRGTGDVTLRRSADGIGLQGQVALKGVEAGPLLFNEGAHTPLQGRAALTMQFEGGGRSPRALIGSLNGSGMLTLEKARVAALDPGAFAAVTRSVDQGMPLDAQRVRGVVAKALEAGPLTIGSADAALAMAGGVVRLETFSADTDRADLAASGAYNLADGRLDLRMAMTGAAVAGAPMRPEIVVALRGPASTPEREVDVSMLTGWLALRSVDRQTKRLEAIEQGRPADAPSPEGKPQEGKASPDGKAASDGKAPTDNKASPDNKAASVPVDPDTSPEAAPLPRPKPAAPAQGAHHNGPTGSAPAALEPLPAPHEIRPAPGERRRPPAQPRVDNTPRPQPSANPFPTPLGSPTYPNAPSPFR